MMKQKIVIPYSDLPNKFGIVVQGNKEFGQDLCQFLYEKHGLEWLGGGKDTTDDVARDHKYDVVLINKATRQVKGYLTYGSMEYVKHNEYPIIDINRKVTIEFCEAVDIIEYNGVKYDRDDFLKALEDVRKFN